MQDYYKVVADEIAVEGTGSGGRKSVLADLNKKKQEVAKAPRKKTVKHIDKRTR